VSKNSVKYLQGINFMATETEIKNLVRATPDSDISRSTSTRIQPYVRKFNYAIYVKHNWGNNCAARNVLLDLIKHIIITVLALLQENPANSKYSPALLFRHLDVEEEARTSLLHFSLL
jgi:hypothetical protein